MSEVVSVRLPTQVAKRLRDRAAADDEAVSGLAQRLVDEGLRMEAHPGIVFRPGPSGRRAALMRGPDVWEVVAVIRPLPQNGQAAIEEVAAWFGLGEDQTRAAIAYYGAFPEEIDDRIAANDAAAEQAHREWEIQQRLLG